MLIERYIFFCGFLYFFIGYSIAAFSDPSIHAKRLYEVEILGPSIVEPCGGRLWVYSVGKKEL